MASHVKNHQVIALKLRHNNFTLEAGCDEAGRGCLAGPVVAAAVILPDHFKNSILNDSKKISESKRNLLRTVILEQALTYGIGIVSPQEIDEINILNASFLAMHRAIDKLKPAPKHLLIDGNRFNAYAKINHTCMIKGDGRFMNIAAASILAKTTRDQIMEKLDLEFPEYGWKQNKGYPTKNHRTAIKTFGSTIHHRISFKLLPEQLKLDI